MHHQSAVGVVGDVDSLYSIYLLINMKGLLQVL